MDEWTDGRKDPYIHTDRQTCMFMHRQTDRHTCTGIDGQTKSMYKQTNRLTETYKITYRDIHARTCRGIHARVFLTCFNLW